MKCFHFTNGERRDDGGSVVQRASSKVSWARSLSVASSASTVDTRRSEFDCSDHRDFSDSLGFLEFLSQRRANDLRVFTFSELKSATRGFSRGLLIGEGGFGCVYRGVVRVSRDWTDAPDSRMEVAIKQLNRNGFQACPSFPFIHGECIHPYMFNTFMYQWSFIVMSEQISFVRY